MTTYSIKELEKLSGIKAHTLRIWEQRYGILKPERTDTNIREYTNSDMRLLLNIHILNSNGYKISHIAKLATKEIEAKVLEIATADSNPCVQVESLVLAMIETNEQKFEKIIATNTLKYNFEHTMLQIIHPFLKRIGIMWQVGAITPAQEHFISNLIRQKLIVAIDGQQVNNSAASESFLLFLPEGELHELSLLFYSYVLKRRNKHVVYLGQSVPFSDLKAIVEKSGVKTLVTVFTHQSVEIDINEYLQNLQKAFPKIKKYVSGFQLMNTNVTIPTNFILFKEPADFISLIGE